MFQKNIKFYYMYNPKIALDIKILKVFLRIYADQ